MVFASFCGQALVDVSRVGTLFFIIRIAVLAIEYLASLLEVYTYDNICSSFTVIITPTGTILYLTSSDKTTGAGYCYLPKTRWRLRQDVPGSV